jgi:tryptophanyl-tRNA synthetase
MTPEHADPAAKRRRRILSGMRPTGRLHIGHLVGALENWVSLQKDFDNYHLVADYHALTTSLRTDELYEHSVEMVIDWLAAGIDPQESPIFRQSQVKEHAELNLIFGMLITKARLERNPTIKEQARDLQIDNLTFGHLGYPVLQAADILLYKGEVVPVGEDQVPHVEITREIARKFNAEFGEVFPEPEARLTKFARLPGLNGDMKMSKSAGNTILISDPPAQIAARMRSAVTDPLKVRRNDPGRPEVCLVFTYHKKFNGAEVPEIGAGCRSGALGCVDCKLKAATAIAATLGPIREKRARLEADRPGVLAVLAEGERKARSTASETMRQVREAMKIG